VDEAGIAWLADELAADPGFAAYCYVDSPDGVAILDRVLTARRAGRRLPVLVEIGLAPGPVTSFCRRLAGLAGAKVTGLNDQHAYLRLDPDTALAPGDLVGLGISHPCTTLDKWRVIPVLDEQDRVIDVVHTFF